MDEAGIAIYFSYYDDNALVWDTRDQVSVKERAFFEALVNRFEHYKHLVWIIAEEYQEELSVSRVSHLAAIIRAADDHSHVIGVHKLSGSPSRNLPKIPISTCPRFSTTNQRSRNFIRGWSTHGIGPLDGTRKLT